MGVWAGAVVEGSANTRGLVQDAVQAREDMGRVVACVR